jgi:integrase
MTNDDKWINLDPRTKKLSIRFRVRGFSRQFYLSTGLKDNKTNRDLVRAKVEIIERDIALNRFDSTLESYKFKNYKNPETPTQNATLGELWNEYLSFQNQHLEQSTLNADYKSITKIINYLPTQSLNDAAKIRNVLLDRYSYHTAYKSLAAFSRCCNWAINSSLVESNPFEKIQLPKPKKRSNDNVHEAYTLEQRDLIISAFESHTYFAHYASLVKFLFWTGCRPGEAFALTWGDISDDGCQISINKAYASNVHETKGTKNNKRRIFSCQERSKLQLLLLEIKPQCPAKKQLIFTNKSGGQLTIQMLDTVWRGQPHHQGVVTKLAKNEIVPYKKIYTTRHTFATWAIASGISPEKVAYWLGDDIKTVLTYYCHPDVTKAACPDF